MRYILIILFIVVSIMNSKKKAEEKRRRTASRQQAPAYIPPTTAGDALPDGAFEWAQEHMPMFFGKSQPEAPSTSGSMPYASTEGFGSSENMRGDSLEGMPLSSAHDGRQHSPITHVVRPFTESDHRHEESSLTGNVPCPPVQRSAAAPAQAKVPAAPPLGLRLDHTGIRQGIIYAEVLGKPKALQSRAR